MSAPWQPAREARGLVTATGAQVVEFAYTTFFPWDGAAFRRAERALARVPVGAQYVVAASRETSA